MTEQRKFSPSEVLDRLFQVIKEEALANPKFAQRMLTAVGCPVMFSGTDAVATADPILVASSGDYKAFYETFSTFSDKDLKALVTNFRLGTAEDVKAAGKSKAKKQAFIDLMWTGARARLAERGVH